MDFEMSLFIKVFITHFLNCVFVDYFSVVSMNPFFKNCIYTVNIICQVLRNSVENDCD